MLRVKQYEYPADFSTYYYETTSITYEGYDGYFDPNGQAIVTEDGSVWGPNLIEGELCYALGIHALPGSRFKINTDELSEITINATGNFSMDFSDSPIRSLRMFQGNNYNIYPTIIDIVSTPLN